MKQQSKENQPSPLPTGYITRPGVVTFICITSLIILALQILGLALYATGQYRPGDEEYAITVAIIAVLLGGLSTIILGLWRAKNWARIGYVILVPLLAVMEVLGDPNITNIARLPFLALLCVLLFRPKASVYFSGMALPPIDPASGLEIGVRKIIRCPTCDKEIYSTLLSCHHCGTDFQHESGHAPAI